MAEALLGAGRIFASHYQLVICDDPRRTVSDEETQAPAPDDKAMLSALAQAGIVVSSALRFDLEEQGEQITALFADGTRHEFDVMYPALGCETRSDLATALGAKCDETGALIVDARQRTGVPGLLAAGDVVSDLHQLSVAVGHAAIASTAIHNGLPRNFR